MSSAFQIAFFLALVALWISLAVAMRRSRKKSSTNSKKSAAANPQNLYHGLRNKILHLKREDIGLPAPANPSQPWAAVMDWGLAGDTVTVVAIMDGTASVYLSRGGGWIGGGQSHDPIRKAAQKMLSAASEAQWTEKAAADFPLPQPAQVIFYVMTDAGVFTSTASQEELSAHRHPLSSLGDAAQTIITQYRLIQKSK
jgi:hypothetical protein